MKSMFRLIKTIFFLLAATLIILFFSQNSENITISFFRWLSPPLSMAAALSLAFTSGFVLAVVYFYRDWVTARWGARRARRTIAELQKEVDHLRNQPLLDRQESDTIEPRRKSPLADEMTEIDVRHDVRAR